MAHLFEADSHIPPAFSQSAFVVYWERSPALPDGLAEGDEVELPDPPVVLLPVLLPDDVPEPVLPDVPEGELELPDEPLPLPLPPVDCAAAMAGAKAMIPTKNVSISFCMCVLPLSNLPAGVFPAGVVQRSKIQALEPRVEAPEGGGTAIDIHQAGR